MTPLVYTLFKPASGHLKPASGHFEPLYATLRHFKPQRFAYGVVREGVIAEIMPQHIGVPELLGWICTWGSARKRPCNRLAAKKHDAT